MFDLVVSVILFSGSFVLIYLPLGVMTIFLQMLFLNGSAIFQADRRTRDVIQELQDIQFEIAVLHDGNHAV